MIEENQREGFMSLESYVKKRLNLYPGRTMERITERMDEPDRKSQKSLGASTVADI